MYEDPRYIRQHVVKVSLNDEELEQLIGSELQKNYVPIGYKKNVVELKK